MCCIDCTCYVQIEVDKPLGLQLGAAKGPNGGLVVKVGRAFACVTM